MATKITVVLEDDLEGGPVDETVRFGISGHRLRDRPERQQRRGFPPPDRPYLEHAHRAGSRQRRLGRTTASWERSAGIRARAKDRASRSAAAAASPPTLSSNTKPHGRTMTPASLIAGPNHPWQPLAPAGGQRYAVGVAHARTCRRAHAASAHSYAQIGIFIRCQ